MGDRCRTKYPILLVHGTGFRDFEKINYWGRIPQTLEAEGATIRYGKQDCWGTIENNAHVVQQSIEKMLAEIPCEKVNIIAHSKGGLEARYAISSLDMAGKIASLTTIATPHRGSKTMTRLCQLPKGLFKLTAWATNNWYRALGDKNPDFYTTCQQFSTRYAEKFNQENPDSDQVYYQSYTAVMHNSWSDLFLFFPHLIVSLFEGKNDGIVAAKSAEWTNFRGVLQGETNRGISHVDEIDLRRRNLIKSARPSPASDIRIFYLDLVAELKKNGF